MVAAYIQICDGPFIVILQVEEDRQHYTDVPEIASKDSEKSIIIDTVIANINWLMSHDRKVTGLKQLQGHMWREGYQSGSIKGQ